MSNWILTIQWNRISFIKFLSHGLQFPYDKLSFSIRYIHSFLLHSETIISSLSSTLVTQFSALSSTSWAHTGVVLYLCCFHSSIPISSIILIFYILKCMLLLYGIRVNFFYTENCSQGTSLSWEHLPCKQNGSFMHVITSLFPSLKWF